MRTSRTVLHVSVVFICGNTTCNETGTDQSPVVGKFLHILKVLDLYWRRIFLEVLPVVVGTWSGWRSTLSKN